MSQFKLDLNKLDDFIGQENVKKQALALIKNPPVSLVLRGGYGLGKTALAILLVAFLGLYTYNLGQLPANSAYTNHVVDEAHMISDFESSYNRVGRENFIFCSNRGADLPEPLLSRCQVLRLEEYTPREIKKIIQVHYDINPSVAQMLAVRSKGNPRKGLKLTERVTAMCENQNPDKVEEVLEEVIRIDANGLDSIDHTILAALAEHGALSKRALATHANISPGEYERRERFLLRAGYIVITNKGRKLV